MFSAAEFISVESACEHIQTILANLQTPKAMEVQVIHSITETECEEDGGKYEDIGNHLLNFLRDLDAQEGYMIYEMEPDESWHFLEWDEPDEDEYNIHKPVNPDEVYVLAGEGVVVIHNKFAVCESQFPIIVVKRSLWRAQHLRITDLLKYCDINKDYTSKISPAVYLELFFS